MLLWSPHVKFQRKLIIVFSPLLVFLSGKARQPVCHSTQKVRVRVGVHEGNNNLYITARQPQRHSRPMSNENAEHCRNAAWSVLREESLLESTAPVLLTA